MATLTMNLLDFPEIPRNLILNFLPAEDLLKLSRTSRLWHEIASDEFIWKRKCLCDWPWFFFDGTCEQTLIYEDSVTQNSQQTPTIPPPTPSESSYPSTPATPSNPPSQSETQQQQHQHRHRQNSQSTDQHPRPTKCNYQHQSFPLGSLPISFPLPKSYKLAYALIASGQCSCLLHVISPLRDRQMSAFLALATYHPPTRSFALNYQPWIISRARRGERILVRPSWVKLAKVLEEDAKSGNGGGGGGQGGGSPMLTDEVEREIAAAVATTTATASSSSSSSGGVLRPVKPLTEADKRMYYAHPPVDTTTGVPSEISSTEEQLPLNIHTRRRFRRVPESLLGWDPREINAKELFEIPLNPQSGAPWLRPGEEVEVQWRGVKVGSAYGWWRGIVGGVGLLDVLEQVWMLSENDIAAAEIAAEKAAEGTDWALEPEKCSYSFERSRGGAGSGISGGGGGGGNEYQFNHYEAGGSPFREAAVSGTVTPFTYFEQRHGPYPNAMIRRTSSSVSTSGSGNRPSTPPIIPTPIPLPAEDVITSGDWKIKVLFPHYPPDSAWHSVWCSVVGHPERNPPLTGALGWVGGIRRVRCEVHRRLWKLNFQPVV
ncbi:hypothetical protein HDU76_004795 [Blyttiomyces sp. JEL0837]|nr:hypothetical protein HDU76_004795 [Blyttiomyces sp. JEL0837]